MLQSKMRINPNLASKVLSFPRDYPVVKGMASYAVLWPLCSLTQEYLEHGTAFSDADWARATRFGIFGTFFMAPVFYGWLKFSGRFFRRKTLYTAITRSMIEQVTYSPIAMAYFFFGMSVLEKKSLESCVNEVKEKFWPTYKVNVIFWPTAQTINFYFVPVRNRIVFVSAASFVWTVFLAHVKGEVATQGHPEQINNVNKNTKNM